MGSTKSNPEDYAKNFLTEYLNGPNAYETYQQTCKENKIMPVKPPVFFFLLFQAQGQYQNEM